MEYYGSVLTKSIGVNGYGQDYKIILGVTLMSRVNKWERQRICSCGTPYLYSKYLSKGLCAACMNKRKEERRWSGMAEKFRRDVLLKLQGIIDVPESAQQRAEAVLLFEAVELMDIGELRSLYMTLSDAGLLDTVRDV